MSPSEIPQVLDARVIGWLEAYGFIVKQCQCGRAYDAAAWDALPLRAARWDCMEDGSEILELRDCECGSTLAVEVTS